MPLIYVTGISGAGKSTVCELLKKSGVEAYDADEEGYNGYFNTDTGLFDDPTVNDNAHSEAWNSNHSWRMKREKVEDLAKNATNKTIYLCGVTANNTEFKDLFSKVIILMIDEDTLHHRIQTRTTNEYGKTPDEWQNILKGYRDFKEKHVRSGVPVIDATQPVEIVVEEILKLSA
jgi:dephospho-CoA kinase